LILAKDMVANNFKYLLSVVYEKHTFCMFDIYIDDKRCKQPPYDMLLASTDKLGTLGSQATWSVEDIMS
jgi:hypothetical protein